MTIENIFIYCELNKSHLKDWFDKLSVKQENLNKQLNVITVYMIIAVIGYYLILVSPDTTVSIVGFTFNDLSVFPKILPLVFSILLFQYIATLSHKVDLSKWLRYIGFLTYKQQNQGKDPYTLSSLNNEFIDTLVPFSFRAEIRKLDYKKSKWMFFLGLFLQIPLFLLFISPIFFQFFITASAVDIYWQSNFARYSVLISIWIAIYTLFYVVKVSHIGYQEAREDRAFLKSLKNENDKNLEVDIS